MKTMIQHCAKSFYGKKFLSMIADWGRVINAKYGEVGAWGVKKYKVGKEERTIARINRA